MKKQVAVMLLAFGTLGVGAVAQTATQNEEATMQQRREEFKQRREARHAEHQQRMAQHLNLTQEQQQSLKALHQEQKQKMDQLANTPLTREQFRDQARELHQGFQQRREQILTPEQREKAKQWKAEHKGKRGGMRMKRHMKRQGAGAPGSGPAL